jgi:hypothetical protein|tara:strand:+ start:722 stop:1015 length:294 start_codon:yes stop_codon:yes gene_type:complete
MYAHLRTYTINKGMMEDWIDLFNKKIIPLLNEANIKVESTWVNEENSKFIWIRSYGQNIRDIEIKEEKFYSSKWWVENVDMVRSHLAHRDILTIISN